MFQTQIICTIATSDETSSVLTGTYLPSMHSESICIENFHSKFQIGMPSLMCKL